MSKHASRNRTSKKHKPEKGGVYLWPNLVTTLALMCGFYSILASINGEFQRACICIFVAMLFDGLDGRIARLVGGESAFGEQYDSLSDLISFGVAPALLIYEWSISTAEHIKWLPERFSWMIPFIYCACAALRLARFNTQIGVVDSRYFIGLPSPSAAGMVAGLVWCLGVEFEYSGADLVYLAIVVTLYAGLMMVAPVKYFSFKKLNLRGKTSFFTMIFMVLALAIIATNPATMLWLIFSAYALHGPVVRGVKWLKRYRAAH
ncbi:MAG: CDP-diacylglycerol--serine O-phosphatidyltransferase [Gammaproteobacteria bacterium]|nr:MAG: CDP-diacylglycerol--serine O-phosphatidyltransferase [Gammaproteobacteria bacterium]